MGVQEVICRCLNVSAWSWRGAGGSGRDDYADPGPEQEEAPPPPAARETGIPGEIISETLLC